MSDYVDQDCDDDSDDAPCWCGVEHPYYSDDIERSCGGSGTVECRCGGDFCVCHNHGAVECAGCEDCDDTDGDPGRDQYQDFDDDDAAL